MISLRLGNPTGCYWSNFWERFISGTVWSQSLPPAQLREISSGLSVGAHFKALGCLQLNLSAGRLREPAPIMELMRAITLGVPALRVLGLHGVRQRHESVIQELTFGWQTLTYWVGRTRASGKHQWMSFGHASTQVMEISELVLKSGWVCSEM